MTLTAMTVARPAGGAPASFYNAQNQLVWPGDVTTDSLKES
jgi:hypothetical protein